MDKYKVKLTIADPSGPLLGTVTKDTQVYTSFIASKAPPEVDVEDELQTVEDLEIKGWTGFHMVDGNPILFDYMIKGFFKDACSMLKRSEEKIPGEDRKKKKFKTLSGKLTAHKKVIDGLVFIHPRQIPIDLHGQEMGVLERPIRVMTPQGERVALTKSDSVPSGSTISFTITILGGVSEALLIEWLDYGRLRGLGQWRNAGFGAFSYEFEK
jgi:hypothetical protein